MAKLENLAEVSGEYLSNIYTDSTQLTVELSAVSVKKTANKMMWIDTDPLEYTIEIKNTDPDPNGETVTDVTLTDKIDSNIVLLDINSVFVDGDQVFVDTDFRYDPSTGEIQFITLEDIPAGGTTTVVFQVNKK